MCRVRSVGLALLAVAAVAHAQGRPPAEVVLPQDSHANLHRQSGELPSWAALAAR
jgi:hypothetical protein